MASGKRFALGLLSTFFIFCISMVAILTAVNVILGTPDALKIALIDGKVYDTAAPSIIDHASKEKKPEDSGNKDLDLSDPVVKGAAKQVITGTLLQGYAEQAIDGTYHWLDGTTKTPDFNLDLTIVQRDLGISISSAIVQRVKSLPACTNAQLLQLDPATIDPLTMPCQPPGFNLEQLRQGVVHEVNTSETFKDTSITPQNLDSEEAGKDPFQQLSAIPVIFQWSKIAPWILGVLGLASAAALIFLRHDRRRGVKAVAVSLLITGGVLLVAIVLTTVAFGNIHPSTGSIDDAQLQQAVLAATKALGSSLNHILLIFAVVYTIGGVGSLLGLHFTKKNDGMSVRRLQADNEVSKTSAKPPKAPTDTDKE
jgi:hypothetical protein